MKIKTIINKLQLLLNTVKYLKLKQLYFRVYYKVQSYSIFNPSAPVAYNCYSLQFDRSIPSPDSCNGNTFKFLNICKTFDSGFDWNFSENGKLWTYNLNYFDFLNQEKMLFDSGIKLIDRYIADFGKLKDGLEPYPISIRGINWIKFISNYRDSIPSEHLSVIENSLFQQYQFLSRNLEYHILGNHLLENGFSLLFGAYYFQEELFYKKAKKILCFELEEQVLEDGAHFELSPMYHQIMLFRVLDCLNLVKNNDWKTHELLEMFELKAKKMLGWLSKMTFRDGSIPLLNDAVNEISPTTNQINQYATELGVSSKCMTLSESGYRKYETKNYECVVDVGHVGPDYQPGHAHADTFNFVLNINGKPIIVDTGTSTYEKNERRHLERSTCSHNTVEVNQLNSSQVWGGFRVAKRASVFGLVEDSQSVEGTHDGYMSFGAYHTRSFKFNENEIIIKDNVQSNTKAVSIAYLHFYPDQFISLKGNLIYGDDFLISLSENIKVSLEEYDCAVEFNKLRKAQQIVVQFDNKLETVFSLKE